MTPRPHVQHKGSRMSVVPGNRSATPLAMRRPTHGRPQRGAGLTTELGGRETGALRIAGPNGTGAAGSKTATLHGAVIIAVGGNTPHFAFAQHVCHCLVFLFCGTRCVLRCLLIPCLYPRRRSSKRNQTKNTPPLRAGRDIFEVGAR